LPGTHNCLSWSLKKLKDIGIEVNPLKLGDKVVIKIPSDYIPALAMVMAPAAAKREPSGPCVIM